MPDETKEPLSTVTYSWTMGAVYIFNLFLGAGLLSLPKAFAEVGLVLGFVGLSVLAMGSYITITFVIEAQSVYNAIYHHQNAVIGTSETKPSTKEEMELCRYVIKNENGFSEKNIYHGKNDKGTSEATKENGKTTTEQEKMKGKETVQYEIEKNSGVYLYEITQKAELGEMAQLFFSRTGVIFYYISICLYLYGGLAVYAAAISKSLTSVVCGDASCFVGNGTSPCKNFPNSSVIVMYRKMLAIFILSVSPFIFFTLTKTKILQLLTMLFRWIALSSMIILAIIKIFQRKGNSTPRIIEVKALPHFFGVALYTFMCQYSIPSVITPISRKKRLNIAVVIVFIFTLVFYALLLATAVYTFNARDIHDLYTLNFSYSKVLRYVLELFPVVTLFTNFPILAIVLRENLTALFLTNKGLSHGVFIRRLLFPLIVIIPPSVIAYCTYNVGMLVGYTGAYAGSIIQYVIPSLLVYFSRKKAQSIFNVYVNRYRSPFYHRLWTFIILFWYLACVAFVTYHKITSK